MYDISENFLASDEGGAGEPAVLKVVLYYRDQSIKRNIEEEIRFSDAVSSITYRREINQSILGWTAFILQGRR